MSTLTIPTSTFAPSTLIKSSEVNANFSAISTWAAGGIQQDNFGTMTGVITWNVSTNVLCQSLTSSSTIGICTWANTAEVSATRSLFKVSSTAAQATGYAHLEVVNSNASTTIPLIRGQMDGSGPFLYFKSAAADFWKLDHTAGKTNYRAYNSDGHYFYVGGTTEALNILSTGVTSAYIFSAPDGAVGAPAYSFTSDLDCGMYRIGANNLGIAVNGAKVLDIGTAGLGVTGTFSATSTVTVNAGANGSTLTSAATGLSCNAPSSILYPGTTTAAGLQPSSGGRTMAIKETGGSAYPAVVSAAPSTHGLKLICGTVTSGATIVTGAGFTVASSATGKYQITFTTAFHDAPLAIATPRVASSAMCSVQPNETTTSIEIWTHNGAGVLTDMSFSFTAYAQRGA